jgi:poly(A) polymerase
MNIVDADKAVATLFGSRRLLDILDVLNGGGEETRIVGGAVRNALLQLPIGDVDLATTAVPDEIIARARAAGFKPVPTGVEHGTVTIVVRGRPFEVTTLREDIATDGRRAIVRFGRDFGRDAQRRDFTVNALSVSADRSLHDPVGGLPDIGAGHIRFIGDARERIREDYLRILRFFRFHAAYGEGPLDRAGLDAAIRERQGLAVLSAERIRAEIMKLVVARRGGEVAQEMSDAGFFERIFAGIAYPVLFARLSKIERTAGDAVLRLGALAIGVREDADRLRTRLRLSNAEHKRLAEMADACVVWHNRDAPPDERDLRTQLFLAGRAAASDALALAHVASGASADDREWMQAANFLRESPEPRLPVTGEDVMASGVRGKLVGAALKSLQARWIGAGFPKEPRAVARLLEEVLAELATAPQQARTPR